VLPPEVRLSQEEAGRVQEQSLFGLRVEVPVRSYAWDEERPGALQVDLVEHNGGSSLGQF